MPEAFDSFQALWEFDREWQSWSAGETPDLAHFIPPDSTSREFVIQLVEIDLDFRWRYAEKLISASDPEPEGLADEKQIRKGTGAIRVGSLPLRPKLEDYVARFPILGDANSLSADLIQHEFRIRWRWGDQPPISEYTNRFSSLSDTLRSSLEFSRVTIERGEMKASSSKIADPDPGSRGASAATDSMSPDRYRKIRKLGEGAFGTVWLAEHVELGKMVALKEPRADRFDSPEDMEAYLTEARMLARLDHPNIVPVYDAGRTAEGSSYIVSKWIEGKDLAAYLKDNTIPFAQSAELVARIADALQQTHNRGLVHRDIKPANILIDEQGNPYVTDFGLAMREEDFGKGRILAGTPAYMSPEQARCEGHRIDGRTDIFSLGVVLYELLTGVQPFVDMNWQTVVAMIKTEAPKSPRECNESIPRELERICLKAMSKRASDRYNRAADMAGDLRNWLANPSVQPARDTRVAILPKGLRSFDANDSDFFLGLLPGAVDRDGLPETLRFWKTRIEETHPEKTFRVGLMYGPSGCGKSSLMKAGLLPRLAAHVIHVFLEATPDQTEEQLLQGLRRSCSDLPRDASLVDSLIAIRRGKGIPAGRKLVLVLDQFEQWLFANGSEPNNDLAAALRQCDGERIQAVLLVRDDFWMPATRLLDVIEVRLVQGENAGAIDLFAPLHARKILAEFGKAYGRVPEHLGQLSSQQEAFLSRAIEGLVQDGKVICVQLALFADMMKGREWTLDALEEVGGTSGIGSKFLEETFSSRTAPPPHRVHQEAARSVLQVLLPQTGTDIKGHRRTEKELRHASGYSNRPQDFSDLIQILDGELRLLTPVTSDSQERMYQLTHDYLVPSLREWLTRKQRETKKGRAELRLAERAAVWKGKQESRQLPTLLEWSQIRYWTDRKRWTPSEQTLMRTAARIHARNWVGAILAIALISSSIGWMFQQQHLRSQQSEITRVLDSNRKTLGPGVPEFIKTLINMKQPEQIRRELQGRYAATTDPDEKLSSAFALAHFGRVESDYMISRIDTIEEQDTGNLIDALSKDPLRSLKLLKQADKDCTTPEHHKRRARLALAALGIGNTDLVSEACEFEQRTDHGVRTHFINEFPKWEFKLNRLVATVEESTSPALRSVVALGLGKVPVGNVSSDEKDLVAKLADQWFKLPDSSTHSAVAWLMREWKLPEPHNEEETRLVEGRDWFVNSQGVTFLRIKHSVESGKRLPNPLEKCHERLRDWDKKNQAEKEELSGRFQRGKDFYAIGEFERALEEFNAIKAAFVDTLADLNDSIREESEGLRLLSSARLKPKEELKFELREWQNSGMNTANFVHVENYILYAIGEKTESLDRMKRAISDTLHPTGNEEEIAKRVRNFARYFAMVAAHQSTNPEVKKVYREQAVDLLERANFWDLNNPRKRIALGDDPDFIVLHQMPRFLQLVQVGEGAITPGLWVANQEVTVKEFKPFFQSKGKSLKEKDLRYDGASFNLEDENPVRCMNWNLAIEYCNWLSEQEHRKPAYHKNSLNLWTLDESSNGYRLPRISDWKFACRAGTSTEWSHGSNRDSLKAYCRCNEYDIQKARKTLPNAWGLHDMHGNVAEWCWDPSPESACRHMLMGGGYVNDILTCTSDSRQVYPDSANEAHFGFRLSIILP